ncbi:MAG: terminase small subunit [Candidatus Xenobiia bacterium LiM19]
MATREPEKKLTPKQKKFIATYLQTQNGTQAAIEAGYSVTSAAESASENLRKSYVKQEIDAVLDKAASVHIADAQEVLRLLTAMARGETKEDTLCFNAKGETTIIQKRAPAQSQVKALELLGKVNALFIDRTQISERVIIFDNIPDTRV